MRMGLIGGTSPFATQQFRLIVYAVTICQASLERLPEIRWFESQFHSKTNEFTGLTLHIFSYY